MTLSLLISPDKTHKNKNLSFTYQKHCLYQGLQIVALMAFKTLKKLMSGLQYKCGQPMSQNISFSFNHYYTDESVLALLSSKLACEYERRKSDHSFYTASLSNILAIATQLNPDLINGSNRRPSWYCRQQGIFYAAC